MDLDELSKQIKSISKSELYELLDSSIERTIFFHYLQQNGYYKTINDAIMDKLCSTENSKVNSLIVNYFKLKVFEELQNNAKLRQLILDYYYNGIK
jgi:hypothetical protein